MLRLWTSEAFVERETIDWKARESSRRGVSHRATIQLPDGQLLSALVTNLSYSGCQLLAEGALVVGETISLTLPGRGTQDAQVRWTAGDCAGLQFLLGQSFAEGRRARIGV